MIAAEKFESLRAVLAVWVHPLSLSLSTRADFSSLIPFLTAHCSPPFNSSAFKPPNLSTRLLSVFPAQISPSSSSVSSIRIHYTWNSRYYRRHRSVMVEGRRATTTTRTRISRISGKSRMSRGERGGGGPAGTLTRVGKYEMGRTLGEGTFAKVKYGRDVHTGDSFAIKVLDKQHVLRHKMVEQIKREISTMKLIKHPNVIQIYEVIASKTKVYIVLEFVNGGELFDKIVNHGKLKEDEARRYFQQLINAVDYCHSRGVYHRDLKPENLLLDSQGILKVADFGLSAFAPQKQEDRLLHTTCGTPNYVAPEVLNDKGYEGSASDVWSCGVILFVLMAGYLPFDEPNLTTLYRKIMKADYACPAWFSSGAKKLISRILDPNPHTRVTIPEILADEWFKKGYKPPSFEQGEDVNLEDIDAVFNNSEAHLVTEKKEKPESMNAFELISRSQGFNLGNLFEEQMSLGKRETRFTSRCSANEIISRIEETAKPLGFNVRKHNYKMKLQGDKSGRKGHLSVATEVFEVAPSLHVVELRKTGGDTLEFHKFYNNFSSGLKDIVWKSETST